MSKVRNKKKHTGLKFGLAGVGLACTAAVLNRIAKMTREPDSIDDDNTYLSDDSASQDSASQDSASGESLPQMSAPQETKPHMPTLYKNYGKTAVDKILSFCGLVVLAPVFAAVAIAIEIDDPGPVIFKQKRVGKDKHFFELHKFRSMKMSTPHDVPTHQMENPDSYITRVGRFLRKTSLDELPQIWDIFRGKMSIIGPRPALWNQEDLVAERDKYGANNVMPGLTGYAQINGRDELEIPVKAALDGEYVKSLQAGNMDAIKMDLKCFVGTIKSVVKGEGVVEGGTGEMKKAFNEKMPEKDYTGCGGEEV